MNNQAKPSSSQLPSYITSAAPNPANNRAPWYSNTAPTYAGIFLWFVFWQDAVNAGTAGGGLAQGIGMAIFGLILSAVICHLFFYVVLGLLGQKTGLPLYIVGTSTFGAQGGFIMPGFLMGVLQFGWLGVNIFFASMALHMFTGIPAQIIMVIWGVLAAFVGLKGIQYVAKVATYLPLIPLAVLLILLFKTMGGLGTFNAEELQNAQLDVTASTIMTASPSPAMTGVGVIAFLLTYVVGFFATAGAAGVDFGTNSRDSRDVNMGGLIGIALAIFVTAGLSILIVAGVYGSTELREKAKVSAKAAVAQAVSAAEKKAADAGTPLSEEEIEKISQNTAPTAMFQTTQLIKVIVGDRMAGVILFLLALAAFPPACFSSFIAANCFKTTMPKVNPFISVGIGAAVSIVLALTGLAGKVIPVFVIIGASFGPICGAMMVDYLINGKQWTGPRAGFNPAGWIAWALGFSVGIMPNLEMPVPAAPVAAFVVGAVVYFLCAKLGLQTAVVPLPARSK